MSHRHSTHSLVFLRFAYVDSYVAVTGLPEPQPSHALIMARFASECRVKMNELVAQLENRLGPDTGDLSYVFVFGNCCIINQCLFT